jgi:hypothetical protein
VTVELKEKRHTTDAEDEREILGGDEEERRTRAFMRKV